MRNVHHRLMGVPSRSDTPPPRLAIVGWGAATVAALLASYSAFKPVRDALVIDGDPDQIPWLFSATFIAVSVVSPMWSGLLARCERRRVVSYSFHGFSV